MLVNYISALLAMYKVGYKRHCRSGSAQEL
jgi:hypothetical protein